MTKSESLPQHESPLCPVCGEMVDIKSQMCKNCQSPLFSFSRWRRRTARLVQKKFKGFFQVYVADEVHKLRQAGLISGLLTNASSRPSNTAWR